ncbi:glycine cleavage system aminomethyltransferase GcvT [Wenzhouxiangella sp. XN79A]|uniref:glycine cleavage system aminomethyltransferase GcvT n=1 Tax=Wenzhouxiangella sp. XN79A TaxID=2724193 RepID=UPI00144ABF1D|nr:glycine cleavage system aminomethyltransferase GcvT [Wenzhouxiangella sp. XN79A]NKI34574.1 glycine cleavage system aminomethyltransferase GcvT [Wenzhouxiangella sp. XN79A]
MTRKTPLFDAHEAAGGRMVEFAGWTLPIRYGSLVEEHRAVREKAGVFDVSHMTVVDVRGSGARSALRRLLANDVDRIREDGQAIYGCMLDDEGGILDDLITYRIEDGFYRLIVNAATREADLAWMRERLADDDLALTERDDLAMLAVQGPLARAAVAECMNAPVLESLKPFRAVVHGDLFIARTGYTGEDGCEIVLPNGLAADAFAALLDAGVVPCGLGARDSLRLEAGLNLYGQDMDTTTTPLESNLAWTVAFEPADRDFIGRAALEAQREAGVPRRLVGLVLGAGGIPRAGARVLTADGEGVVTSGGFGPTVERPIAMARIPAGTATAVEVELRGRRLPARVVKLPFVRGGKILDGVLDD